MNWHKRSKPTWGCSVSRKRKEEEGERKPSLHFSTYGKTS
jgi:hypothetical protein